MRVLQRYIAAKGCQFARHPFFSRLEENQSPNILKAVAPTITAWVMNYQDFLRINESRIEDTSLRGLVRCHRAEEVGHDQWFLEDLRALNGGEPDLHWIFGRQHAAARDATHSLMAEVQQTRNDAERLALLLVCESTGEIFFDCVERHLRYLGRTAGLKFFAGMHLQAERNHELFQNQMELTLSNIQLEDEVRNEACALVDRGFAAFHLLMDGSEEALRRAAGTARAEQPSPADEGPTVSAA